MKCMEYGVHGDWMARAYGHVRFTFFFLASEAVDASRHGNLPSTDPDDEAC